MRFAKLQGLGNDFVLLDLRQGGEPLTAARALELCDRHLGIGADGVLTLLPGDRMLVQNADGSVPEMCGNGARCAALWIATAGGTRAATATVPLMTDAGPRPCKVQASSPRAGMVEVEMGKAELSPARALPGVDLGPARGAEAVPVSMGNPHRVIFSGGDISRLARELGPALCASENANIEFVERLGPQRYAAAVFERGAGLTQACGTGACAVAAAAVARGEAKRDEEIEVQLPGGSLFLRVGQDNHVLMRGPAKLVFVGEL
ncbi:MAG TPA: diaminopimelate epimerase [Myxococcales bacterium]|jgi:diaminopimelate epimerase|nr:diaminopimelate epimerase [Myxococcales bacterium]